MKNLLFLAILLFACGQPEQTDVQKILAVTATDPFDQYLELQKKHLELSSDEIFGRKTPEKVTELKLAIEGKQRALRRELLPEERKSLEEIELKMVKEWIEPIRKEYDEYHKNNKPKQIE